MKTNNVISSKFAFNSIAALCLGAALITQGVKHKLELSDAEISARPHSVAVANDKEFQETSNVVSLALMAGGFYTLGMATMIPGRRKERELTQG